MTDRTKALGTEPASTRRFMASLLVLMGAWAIQGGSASNAHAAGTWTTFQCPSAAGSGAPDATPNSQGGGSFNLTNGCTSSNPAARELAVTIPGAVSYGEYAEWGFDAPAGTKITDISTDALLETSNHTLLAPQLYYRQGADFVFASGNQPNWQTVNSGSGLSASRFGAAVTCISTTPGQCRPLNAGIKIADVHMALEDLSPPPAPGTSGPFVDNAWVRQSPSVTVNGSDQGGGVSVLAVVANGGLAGSQDVCSEQYVPGTGQTQRMRPCGPSASHTFTGLNTAQAPFREGANDVYICSVEFGTNANPGVGCAPRTVNVDNLAPAQPQGFTVAGGSGWRSSNDFDVSWTNPADSGSPLAGAAYEILNQQGQVVEGPTFVPGSTTSLSNIDVPSPGEYTLRVRTRDSAGNESPSVSTTLRFDNTAPLPSSPSIANGWLSRGEFPYLQQWQRIQGPPPSGIKGYAVVIDRSANTDPCDPTGTGDPTCSDAEITNLGIDNRSMAISDLSEGLHYVHVVAVSGASVPSGAIKHAELKVDKTDPNVELEGVPAGPTTNEPVTLVARATDALSGMQPNPAFDDGQPRTVIEVNGQIYEESGEDVAITLSSDGNYTVRYWARDLAGNETPGGDAAHTASFTIDNLAPDLDIQFKAKKRVQAGGKTKFKGYVHAAKAVIPPQGKLIEVQAKVGKQWKTVGEAFRTDGQGNYAMNYRFRKFYTQPTRFKFRLKVLPEPGWPYSQPVYSKKRKVKVIPRHG